MDFDGRTAEKQTPALMMAGEKGKSKMKPAGYEECYASIMAARLSKPHVCPSFTEYFQVSALDTIRDKYGVDLYRLCLKDATADIERRSWEK